MLIHQAKMLSLYPYDAPICLSCLLLFVTPRSLPSLWCTNASFLLSKAFLSLSLLIQVRGDFFA